MAEHRDRQVQAAEGIESGHQFPVYTDRLINSLRAELLARRVRPTSPLGLMAVAAGAFAGFLRRGSAAGLTGAIDDVAQYSSQQIFALASFVEQVGPEALRQVDTALLTGTN
ncbi:MAG TPA: hypothetical protein VET87_01120 [Rubrivivax sp.]|nr:hypothetical protein [Rubrivivax sp.]